MAEQTVTVEAFSPEAFAAQKVSLEEWQAKFPEAAVDLAGRWKGFFMTAGHKAPARQVMAMAGNGNGKTKKAK
jgi:hypothetical protein